MPEKRIRSDSDQIAAAKQVRQREQDAERSRRYRERQRTARQAAAPPSTEQLQQGERIVDLLTTQEDTTITAMQLGLRVAGVTLAQDAANARLQHEALPIDEHEALYQGSKPGVEHSQQNRQPSGIFRQFAAASRATHPQGSHQGQPDLSQYFRTLPPLNPVSSIAQPTESNAPSVDVLMLEERAQSASRHSSPAFLNHSLGSDPPTQDAIFNSTRTDSEDDYGRSDDDVASSTTENASTRREQAEHSNRDAASSPLAFESEHSANEIDSDGEEIKTAALDFVVQKLFEQLQGGFHGCSNDEHEESLREHINSTPDDHNGLDALFNDRTFPSVLGLSEMISADRLARQHVPTTSQWEAMFCGTTSRPEQLRPRPMHVCLHKEETQAIEPQVAFDIDSFLGFASSLAMARQGLWYQPAPQKRQNMTADNHLEAHMFHPGTDPEQPERVSSAMLRDIPHFLLGRIVGAHDITVHVLFPHIAVLGDKFRSLTSEQLSRWLDRVFHPSVYKYCEAHYNQHLPASYQHALANSKAHQVEGRLIEIASYQAQQSIGYHLQPEYLEQIWLDILETIDQQPGLADFREPQLFFSAKGTKLQFKTSPSRPTLLDAMDNFVSFLERVVDLNFVQLERLYVDVGKEICPRISLLPSQQGHVGDEPQVYMWKRCCLEKYMQWAYDEKPPGLGQGQRYYEQNMLYEACNLTSVTPKRSKLREGGLVYSQFYGSIKEVSDATKCYPFDNDGLEELALDPQILRGACQAAGGRRRDAKIIEHAYCASKRRAKIAVQDSIRKSFGIREEHRITWDLFQGLRSRLEEEDRESLEVMLLDCPSYAWAIKTQVYLNFLWRSADKFATGFEVVRARCREDLVTWEQTKVMAMFLRCLRFVFGGHQLSRESALWWSRRERSTEDPTQLKVWYGLGFCNTMKRYGYCWLEPRMDWSRLQFKAEITDHALFGNAVLRGQYLRRGGQVQAFFHLTRRMELALSWIEQFRQHNRSRERLLSWMCYICLEQFRQDVLHSVKHEILPQHQEEALQGKVGFCMEYFDEIMADGVHLVSGNRCDFKRVHDLGLYLFNFNDGLLRKHWEDKPYRKLFQRASAGLSVQEDGRAIRKAFQKRLFRLLYEEHWILPYPTAETFLQTNKQGQRMWYSIEVEDEAQQRRGRPDWRWGRKSWEIGRPEAVPEWVSWSKEEWEVWLPRVANPDMRD